MLRQYDKIVSIIKEQGCSMFGYIRPHADELRVKEYAYYRALYCGVCRSMEKNVSPLLSFTLRYDFVLLAMVRMLFAKDAGEIVPRRCMAHPTRKRPMMADNASLFYTSDCAAILTYFGILDNISDERGFKRLCCRMAKPIAARMYRKALGHADYTALDATVTSALSALSALEAAGESSPDLAAEPFGILLGAMFADGMEGTDARLAASLGHHIGRFIYLCDALDDAPGDALDGGYNPYVCAARAEQMEISAYLRENRERIECALRMECTAAHRALALLDGAEDHPAYPCVENILLLGMPKMLLSVLDAPGEKRTKKDLSK